VLSTLWDRGPRPRRGDRARHQRGITYRSEFYRSEKENMQGPKAT
jgi:hypothetical protein